MQLGCFFVMRLLLRDMGQETMNVLWGLCKLSGM